MNSSIIDWEQIKRNITSDNLYYYYIVLNHSVKSTLKYFNIKSHILEKLLKEYNIKKHLKHEKLEEIMERVEKEKLKKYYIIENHSWEETRKYFHLTSTSMDNLLHAYNLNKIKNKQKYKDIVNNINPEEIKIFYNTHSLIETERHFNISENHLLSIIKEMGVEKKKKEISSLLSSVGKEKLYAYYIEQNHTQKETMKHFNLKENHLIYLIREYKLYKNRKLEELASELDRDTIYKYYVEEDHGPYDSAKYFGLSVDNFYKLINFYGLDNLKTSNIAKIIDRVSKQDLENYYIKEDHSKEETCQFFNISGWECYQLLKHYGVNRKGGSSNYETKILHYLPQNTPIIKKDRGILDGQEIDIYLPEYKIGIEFNGTYWHSSVLKDKNYHFEKSKLAEQKGVRLIHINQWEWDSEEVREKLISLLHIATNQLKTRIYARNCDVKKITNAEAKLFNNKNHLQNHRNAQVTYGLFYKGELVQLMSFSKTRYNRNIKNGNHWEIIRGCPGSNNIVVGGVSKLFKHFIRDYNPDSIFSYCDFNKFDGRGYEILGVNFVGYTGPDLYWILKDCNVVRRQPSKHRELKEKAVAQFWGAGSKKYVWLKK